jgi:hypothetical protein
MAHRRELITQAYGRHGLACPRTSWAS